MCQYYWSLHWICFGFITFFYFSVLLVSIFYCCYYVICLISVGLTVLWFPKVGASFLQSSCCCGYPSGPWFSLLFYCVVFIAITFIALLLLFSCTWYFLWSMNYLEMCHIVSSSWIFSHFSSRIDFYFEPIWSYGYRANLYGFNSFKFVEACVIYIGKCSMGIQKEYALCCIIEMPVESVGWCWVLQSLFIFSLVLWLATGRMSSLWAYMWASVSMSKSVHFASLILQFCCLVH